MQPMVQFDFSGKVEVLVQKNNGELRSAVVRPLSKGIQAGDRRKFSAVHIG